MVYLPNEPDASPKTNAFAPYFRDFTAEEIEIGGPNIEYVAACGIADIGGIGSPWSFAVNYYPEC